MVNEISVDHPHPSKMFDHFELSDHERKRRELEDLIRGSDINRDLIAHNLVEQSAEAYGSGSRGVYWLFHQNHFKRNPVRAMNADMGISAINPHIGSKRTAEQYQSQVGKIRHEQVKVLGFPNTSPEYLEHLERIFFTKVDRLIESLSKPDTSREQKIFFLGQIDALLAITHFPLEGNGRTSEDFLVYVAKKISIDLTLSQSGLRGTLDNDLIGQADYVRSQVLQLTLFNMLKRAIWQRYPDISARVIAKIILVDSSFDDSVDRLSSHLQQTGRVKSTFAAAAIATEIGTMARVAQPMSVEELIKTMGLPIESTPWADYTIPLSNFGIVFDRATKQTYNHFPPLLLRVVVPILAAEQALSKGVAISRIDAAINELVIAANLSERIEMRLNAKKKLDSDAEAALIQCKKRTMELVKTIGHILKDRKSTVPEKVAPIWVRLMDLHKKGVLDLPEDFPEVFSEREKALFGSA